MGVTIHYRGTLDDPGSIDQLRRELADIGKSMGWETSALDDSWQEPPTARLVSENGAVKIKGSLGVKGVSMSPGDGSESLSFKFDAKGRLRSLIDLLSESEGQSIMERPWVSVKTQFASPDLHVWVIGLLKYLKKRYMADLEVSDEGEYWETGDREALVSKMQLINDKINWLSEALTSPQFADLKGLSAEQIALRIEQFLQDKPGDKP